MADKVQLIKEEIERRYNCEKCYPLDREANVAAAVLQELLLFIDSLPEEPTSEDLEEYAKKLAKGAALDKHNLIWMCKKGAEWQKEKHDKQFGFLNLKDCKDAYNRWKSTQDNPSAALAWVRACEWQKQQMIKDAVEGEVVYQIGSAEIAPTDIQYKVVSDRVYIPNVKLGDKVKIIIVK